MSSRGKRKLRQKLEQAAAASDLPQGSQVKLLRWNLSMAAAEYGLDFKTVKKRVAASGATPGADGFFSTAQLHSAIYGDYDKERTRKRKEDADAAALANAKERGELVDKQDFVARLEKVAVSARQEILALARPDADKDALLNV